MSTKGKDHSRKWLISKLKTSGSKRRYVMDGDYSDTRNAKSATIFEDLPSHESMGKSSQFYNGKINYGLLVRFLLGNIGRDWALVHQEILERIPENLYEYKECIQWFVADLVEEKEGKLWDKREQKFLRTSVNDPLSGFVSRKFYVQPESNLLLTIEFKQKGVGIRIK